MGRATGIGGVFFRARDPAALQAWYTEQLGLPLEDGTVVLRPAGGAVVWSPFREDTDYFGPSGQGSMVNYRVDDLDAVLERLRAAGTEVDERVVEEEYGRFGWAVDPEGNRFELWEPAEGW
jgi:predicted enzyme related to lactoylglutathione lyase